MWRYISSAGVENFNCRKTAIKKKKDFKYNPVMDNRLLLQAVCKKKNRKPVADSIADAVHSSGFLFYVRTYSRVFSILLVSIPYRCSFFAAGCC